MKRIAGTLFAAFCLSGLSVFSGGCWLENNPASPPAVQTPVDSSAPVPYMSSAVVYQDTLYVACQRLKNFLPADTSCIVKISTKTDSIIGKINLKIKNPQAITIVGTSLFVAGAGSYGDPTDGGVEEINLTNGQNLETILNESAVGGDISSLCMVSATAGYVTVSKNSADFKTYWTEVYSFNTTSGGAVEKIDSIDNAFGGLCSDDRYLYVGDRSATRPGVVVVDPLTNTKIRGPFNIGMLPASLAYFKQYGLILAGTSSATQTEGNFSTLDTALTPAIEPNMLPVNSDNVVKTFGDAVYILERYGKDNLIRINGADVAAGGTLAGKIVYKTNIGTGVNIQDIAFASTNKAYITELGSVFLQIVDPTAGTKLSTIDLSRFDAYAVKK